MNRHVLILLALGSLMAGACAKSTVNTTGQDAQEYLEMWMDKYYPGVKANEDGLYILEDVPGTGETWNSEKPYVCTDVTIRTLGRVISTTTDKELAQQLGTYVKGYYYGPKYQALGAGTSYAGVDALLKGMKMGGTRTAVVPAWMLTTSRFGTQQEFINACSVTSSLIYTISPVGQTDDPEADGIEALRDYVTAVFGADVKPCTYLTGDDAEVDGSFYFISDTTAFAGTEHLASDASVSLNYTGMLLGGNIFDTSVENVAKEADAMGIGTYSADKSYKPVTINYASSYENITMGTSTSLINGFKGALSLMHWKGQKATVLFTSKHGYSSSGSGSAIPAYAPLIFELEIVKD